MPFLATLALISVAAGFFWAWGLILTVPLMLFVLWFFRDPERTPEGAAEKALLCPADGKIVEISETDEPEFIKGRARKIAIFMSVVSVHVNRAPCDGVVKWTRHIEGLFLNALLAKSGLENERVLIAMERANGEPLLMKQVAGLIARRIVCPLKPSDELKQGKRFGMIKFGSRVEVFIPASNAFEVKVKLGQMVKAGQTLLGEWK